MLNYEIINDEIEYIPRVGDRVKILDYSYSSGLKRSVLSHFHNYKDIGIIDLIYYQCNPIEYTITDNNSFKSYTFFGNEFEFVGRD